MESKSCPTPSAGPDGARPAVAPHCGFLAVLPSDPTLGEAGARTLEATCRRVRCIPGLSCRVAWMASRQNQLLHPALPEPLVYLEIMVRLDLETTELGSDEADAVAVAAFDKALMLDPSTDFASSGGSKKSDLQ